MAFFAKVGNFTLQYWGIPFAILSYLNYAINILLAAMEFW